MKKKVPQHKKTASDHPVTEPENQNKKKEAEPREVAGRHKNDGQIAHKGAR